MTPDFAWNTKCIIQGVGMCTLFYAGANEWWNNHEDIGLNGKSAFIFALIFAFIYATNAFLDIKFGCEHGDFWKAFS